MNRGTLHAQLQGATAVNKLNWELLMLPQQDRQQLMQGDNPAVAAG